MFTNKVRQHLSVVQFNRRVGKKSDKGLENLTSLRKMFAMTATKRERRSLSDVSHIRGGPHREGSDVMRAHCVARFSRAAVEPKARSLV